MTSKVSFNSPLTYTDGSTIAAADLAGATYALQIDTVNPPVKSFPVPAANVAAAVANPDGSKHITVAFSDVGFVPLANVTYFVAATDTVLGSTSVEAADVSFTNVVAPNPPSAVSVS